jgi:hypothetical protein
MSVQLNYKVNHSYPIMQNRLPIVVLRQPIVWESTDSHSSANPETPIPNPHKSNP